MLQTREESRLINNPVARVARWILPWVLLVVVGYYLWGFYTEFQSAERVSAEAFRTAEEKAMETSSTATASATVEASGTALKNTTATTLVDGVRLRTTPKKSGQLVASVGKGTKLVLIEQRGAWYRASDPLGRIGWISGSAKLIKVESK